MTVPLKIRFNILIILYDQLSWKFHFAKLTEDENNPNTLPANSTQKLVFYCNLSNILTPNHHFCLLTYILLTLLTPMLFPTL